MKTLAVEEALLLDGEGNARRSTFRFLSEAQKAFDRVVVITPERGRCKRALGLFETAWRRASANAPERRITQHLDFAVSRPDDSFLICVNGAGVKEGQFPRPSSLTGV